MLQKAVPAAEGVVLQEAAPAAEGCAAVVQLKAAPAAEGCAVTEAAGYLDRQRSPTRSTNKAFNSGYTTTSIN